MLTLTSFLIAGACFSVCLLFSWRTEIFNCRVSEDRVSRERAVLAAREQCWCRGGVQLSNRLRGPGNCRRPEQTTVAHRRRSVTPMAPGRAAVDWQLYSTCVGHVKRLLSTLARVAPYKDVCQLCRTVDACYQLMLCDCPGVVSCRQSTKTICPFSLCSVTNIAATWSV